MAYLILGLLMIRNLTIYDIKNTLEKKISPFYAASFGSIQAAIKKLLGLEQIGFTERVENGRNKKEYFITPEGRTAFYAWMKEDIPVNKFNNEALVKVFFFGFLSRQERVQLLGSYIERLRNEHTEMAAFEKNASAASVPALQQATYAYQMAALDYGIQGTAFEIQWYQSLLEKIEKEEI
jgi:DNA-binding PadR family transcriptional regulator